MEVLNKIQEVIKAAKDNNCSMRVGVNSGSLEKQVLDKYAEPNPDALVESAKLNIKYLKTMISPILKLVLSLQIFLWLLEAYRTKLQAM